MTPVKLFHVFVKHSAVESQKVCGNSYCAGAGEGVQIYSLGVFHRDFSFS
jgi:hypothetical protein